MKTDEEIIKGLELCSTYECSGCPYINSDRLCTDELIKDAFELAKRQRTEIEKLKKQNTLLLKKKCKDINTATKIIKAEAIKEFAERLCKGRVENDPIVIAVKAELDYVIGVGLDKEDK